MSIIRCSSEERHFSEGYAQLLPDSPSLVRFLDSIYEVLRREINFDQSASLLDIGCGRGYFLHYLKQKGFQRLQGIDPGQYAIDEALFEPIANGRFEDHPFECKSFDIVFTCHTLHHLVDPSPVNALKEMFNLAKRYVIVVEINNTNPAMFLRSWALRKVERNAHRYNLGHVQNMFRSLKTEINYSKNIDCGYLSGNSMFHRLASRIGSRPYNISIASLQNHGMSKLY